MVKIILVGCLGKMGRVISSAVTNFPNATIVAGVDKMTTNDMSYPVYTDIKACKEEFDVVLDFSRPDSLTSLLDYCIPRSKSLVLCTTGYTEVQLETIDSASKLCPIFHSANMSIGINIVNGILKKISGMLYENFDIEMIEKHHNQKVDSPSGTALLLANTIKSSISEETEFVHGRNGIAKRDPKEIGIHAVRGGSIIGDHEIIFAGQGELIEIKHSAISRDVFAVGALKACAFMLGKTAGLYSMDDVVNFK